MPTFRCKAPNQCSLRNISIFIGVILNNGTLTATCSPPSREQFSTFLVRDLPFSRFYEFRVDQRLLAVAVTDLLPNGLSAVYTFYEPDEERRSLGRYAILWQIAEAARLQLQAVYLGYWIKNCKR